VTPQGSSFKQGTSMNATPIDKKVITPSQRLKQAFNFQSSNLNNIVNDNKSYKIVNNQTTIEDELQ
jgi:hypothetical protein